MEVIVLFDRWIIRTTWVSAAYVICRNCCNRSFLFLVRIELPIKFPTKTICTNDEPDAHYGKILDTT